MNKGQACNQIDAKKRKSICSVIDQFFTFLKAVFIHNTKWKHLDTLKFMFAATIEL